MKRISSALIIILIFNSYTIYSQNQESDSNTNEKKHNFWYGPKAGLDLSSPTVSKSDIKAQLQSNYQVGFFFQIGRQIYLQPEFYYAVEKESRDFLDRSLPGEVMVNSLKVPVLLGIKLIDLGVISAHFMAGPMGTFFLSESQYDPEIVRKKTNYKLQLGGGVDILGFITFDLRYGVNLDDEVQKELSNLSWKSGVNITLGLKLR